MINEESSPPISARLQALSNSLRLLCSSTPTCKIPVSDDPCGLVSTDAVTEQQTLKMERSLQVYDEEADANPTTPWERLSKRSTGLQVRFDKVMVNLLISLPFNISSFLFVLQKLLVEDLLRFINTASK